MSSADPQDFEARERRWRDWMRAAQSGDSDGYERLLRELLPHLRRFVGRRLHAPDRIEDVVQNALLSLHRARHTYRAERPFGPWLHAIARNAVVDCLRSQGRRAGVELSLDADGVPEPVAAALPEPEAGLLSPELVGALDALTPIQREAVELIQLQGLSVAEAARRVGVSQSALKVRAHRGYRALRARLEGGR